MRRLVQTFTLALTALLLSALPATAAEDAPVPPAEGFGSGMWDGLLLAAVFGLIVGVVIFIDAYSGTQDEATGEHDHDDHH